MPGDPGLLALSLAAAVAAVALQLFFGLVAAKWPQSYYSATDAVDRRVSGKWYRFVLFRFLPVYVVLTAVAGAFAPSGPAAGLVIGFTAAIHLLLTVGRALLSEARRLLTTPRIMLVQLGVALGVGLTALAARYTLDFWVRYLPGFDKYIEVLSTGVVAAMATMYLQKWTTSTYSGFDYGENLFDRLPRAHIDSVVRACKDFTVDRDLALAILIAEQMQRPDSVRKLEYLVGRVNPRLVKTYGPMQGSSDPRVSDEESIRETVARLSGSVLPRDSYSSVREVDLLIAIERHNRSDVFLRLVQETFNHIGNDVWPSSQAIGADGSPAIRKIRCFRRGSEWIVWGDIADGVAIKSVDCWRRPPFGSESPAISSQVTDYSVKNGRYRRIWTIRFSTEYDTVRLIGQSLGAFLGTESEMTIGVSPRA